MALSAARLTPRLDEDVIPDMMKLGVKASTKVYQGGIAVIDAGYAAPARAALGLKAVGRFERTVDNSSGASGDLLCEVRQGVFKFANSANADAIATADLGKTCYLVDDQTVAKTDSNGARSPAGPIISVDSDGVWVLLSIVTQNAPAFEVSGAVPTLISIPVNLADITAATIFSFVPGFAGRILKAQFSVLKPATTGSKLATLQPQIGGVSTTGGAIALTSALCTPTGAVIQGSAITAADSFSATDTVSILGSGVTAFVEGNGSILLTLG